MTALRGGLPDTAILWLAAAIEFVGSLVVVFACARAMVSLVGARGSREGLVRARLVIAEGAVAALGFKTAATLLKTLELRTWAAIGAFTAILALRTFIKRNLSWEAEQLRRRLPREGATAGEKAT